jgi:hypothetical protein
LFSPGSCATSADRRQEVQDPQHLVSPIRTLSIAVALLGLAACQARTPAPKAPVRLTSARLSVDQLQKLAAGADPRALGLAPAGPVNALPPPQTLQASGPAAEALNAERPFARLPIEPMRPFVLKTDAPDQARAVRCLAQAVYYEAAREPLKGQEAVAQVVLNRVRHPAYPKSVCGVVYQGASLATGCQFTFTCDGSLRAAPQAALWDRAIFVARQALDGFVDKDVGSATHYHADYVAPYWAPTLVKMTKVGQQIFYRWDGAWGEPAAFTGHYAGHEAMLTPAVLQSAPTLTPAAPALERRVTLAASDGQARTYRIANPGDTAGDVGLLHASRRQPTRDEVQAINAKLAALEAQQQAPSAGQAAVQTAAQSASLGN